MKRLFAFGESYEAKKIVKTSDSIIGYNGDTEVFVFRGIKDWSQYQLADGQEWDIDEKMAEAAFLLDLDFRVSMLELGVV